MRLEQTRCVDPDRVLLRQIVSALPGIIRSESPQQKWASSESWRGNIVAFLTASRPLLDQISHPGIVHRLRNITQYAIPLLQPLKHPESGNSQLELKTAINRLSRHMGEEFSFKQEDLGHITEHQTTLDQLFSLYPNRFQEDHEVNNGIQMRVCRIMPHDNSPITPAGKPIGIISIPEDYNFAFKGSDARVMLKAYAAELMRDFEDPRINKLRDKNMEAEFPQTDQDVVLNEGDTISYNVAVKLGIGKDGIELIPKGMDFKMYAAGRDIGPNQVYLTYKKIVYSNVALDQIISGVATITGMYVSGKALYNSDTVIVPVVDENGSHIDNEALGKPRAGARVLKFLCTEKIRAFRYLNINGEMFDIGLYSLFLMDKWKSRADFPVMLQKMFHVLGQMHQVNAGESIFDYFNRAHETYPFFKFDSSFTDDNEIVEWLLFKIAKQIEREGSWAEGLSSGVDLSITTNERDSWRILSLAGFKSSPAISKAITSWTNDFVTQCNTRNALLGPQTNYERMFFSKPGYDELDLLPDI